MTTFFDDRECVPAAQREQALFARLPKALRRARALAPAIAAQLEGIDADAIWQRSDLERIPVLRKSDLLRLQASVRSNPDTESGDVINRVFGGFSSIGWGEALRVFASPGPIYEPESARADYWRFGRALHAAGFRARNLVYNCFSYHFTPAGSMMETAAHALGCTVFPGGVGQTEQQATAMANLAPDGYTGTPSFLKIILEKADELGLAVPSLNRALFSGEAFPPSLNEWFSARGIEGYQAYGSADLGMVAYETSAHDGLVVDEDVLLEIVRPGTNQCVEDGEVGEVVVTTLNPDYPLVRFGTGDLSAVMPAPSPCGRTNTRIKGWLGRADQTTKVRGMFVHPEQIARVVQRHPEINKARLVVGGMAGSDVMKFQVEVAQVPVNFAQNVAESVRDITKLRADVELVLLGALPNDGKVIEDARSYK